MAKAKNTTKKTNTKTNTKKEVKVQKVKVAPKVPTPVEETVTIFGYEMNEEKFNTYLKYGVAAIIVIAFLAIVF